MSMKTSDLSPYHLFKKNGRNFVFDINNNAFLTITDVCYYLLELYQMGYSEEHIKSKLFSKYDQEKVETSLREFHFLCRNGFYVKPVQIESPRQQEKYIKRLLKMATHKIELYLSEACNLRCKYCYVDGNKALHNKFMSWDVAKASVDLALKRARSKKDLSITFFGGEPLMNKPVLRKLIEYTQGLRAKYGTKINYSLTTNATLLDDEIISYIKRYNFGLMISMDGPKEVQDNMRPLAGGGSSFDLAAPNIKKLMDRRRQVTVRCTLSNECLDKVRIVDYLREFGFSRVAMSRCNGKSYSLGKYDIGPEENKILEKEDDILMDRFFEELRNGIVPSYNPISKGLQEIHRPIKRNLRCGVARGCTTVGVDGSLYPCHRYVGMENYVIGDVYKGVDDEKHTRYLEAYFSTKSKCSQCWAMNICGGCCPWYVSHENGECIPPKDWWCDGIRDWFETCAWAYAKIKEEYPWYFEKLFGEKDKSTEVKNTEKQSNAKICTIK